MKKLKRIISATMVLLLLFSNLQLPCPESGSDTRVYAAEDSSTVTDAVYSDEEIVSLDDTWLTADLVLDENDYTVEEFSAIIYYGNITKDLYLPKEGPNQSTISWTSSDETVVTTEGRVIRPSETQGDQSITLTATISSGECEEVREFVIVVSALEPGEEEILLNADYDWLDCYILTNYETNFLDMVDEDLNLPTSGVNGSTISWTSSNDAVIATDGKVIRPSSTYGNVDVVLTAHISYGSSSIDKIFWATVLALPITNAERVALDKEWLTTELVLNENNADDVKLDLYMPASGPNGSFISWTSSDEAVIATSGKVNRPDEAEGDKPVTLTAAISYEGTSYEKTFNLLVTVVEELILAVKFDGSGNNESSLQFNGTSGFVNTTDGNGDSIRALQFNTDGTVDGGSVFTKNKLHLSEDMSFSTSFSYRNVHNDFTVGDGGFTFTLQPVDNTLYGQDSGTLGTRDIKPSLSIAVDTDYYAASGSGQGTFYGFKDVLEVFYNGNNDATYENGRYRWIANANTNNPPTLYYVWVEYNGTAQKLEVRLNTLPERPLTPIISIDADLGEILMSAEDGLPIEDIQEVYAGFTGSVGTAKERSEICSWYFKNGSEPIDFDAYNFIDASNITIWANPSAGASSSTITAAVYGDGGPVEGMKLDFSTSIGTLDSYSMVTDVSGEASVILSTDVPGTAVVKAIAAGGAMAYTDVLLALTDEDCVAADYVWLNGDQLLNGNSALDNITKDLNLPLVGRSGSSISWISSNVDVIALNGAVSRPTLVQGDRVVTLTASISKGSYTVGKAFTVTVKVQDGDLAAADRDWLTAEQLLNGNSSLDSILGDLKLPVLGPNGSNISWTSNNIVYVKTDGKVNRPTFTQGDRSVTLTATIKKDTAELNRIFNVTVKALEPTDSEAAYADYMWLTEELVLNGNIDRNNVTANLNLPVLGPKGSVISWASTNEALVALDGTVNRPSYTQGDKTFTLTGTVKKGSIEYTKAFYHINVKALDPTDTEAVDLDAAWLTDSIILNGNSYLNYVYKNLILPVAGPRGSAINWTSNMETVIKPDGTVVRPAWIQGSRLVKLTADISRGPVSTQKTFTAYVWALDQTIEEAVTWDINNLHIYRTLGQNKSPYSVTQNLSLPDTGYYQTEITWKSGLPSVISDSGVVTRPEYGQPHKTVTLTATVAKGDKSATAEFTYTVLAKPDTYPPLITATTPVHNSTDVVWDTRQITLTFNEDIMKGTQASTSGSDTYGIELHSADSPELRVSIDKKTLNIILLGDMAAGENELVIPAGAITDMSGNPVEACKLPFSVEQKLTNKIEIVSSSPADGDRLVPLKPEISFSYNYGSIDKGSSFSNITLRTKAEKTIPVIPVLSGDKISLGSPWLEPGVVYEVIIPPGAVKDRFDNYSSARTIRFRTDTGDSVPQVTGTYPLDGQNGVDIHQQIEVRFSEEVIAKDCKLKLKDSEGNLVSTYIVNNNTQKDELLLQTYIPLKPNTSYTVAGPYDSAADPSALEFSMSFTTGANTIDIKRTSPGASEGLSGIPINAHVELEFSTPVADGPELSNIEILDSHSNAVSFTVDTADNKVILTPTSGLGQAEAYTVKIPGAAFKNTANEFNDALQFRFTTAEKLEPDTFAVSPSGTWLVDKPVTFDITGIESAFKTAKYEIASISWDFGDGSISGEKNPVHTYIASGDYDVGLTIKDSKGFTYDFNQTVTIGSLSNLQMSISHIWDDTIYARSTSLSSANKLYKLQLEYNGTNVPGETITVQLYKNGVLQESFGTKTVDKGDKEYTFPFYYEGYGYLGAYELVFTYMGPQGQMVLREPVMIREIMSKITMRVKLYARELWDYYEAPDSMVFELNGEKKVGVKEWYNSKDGYCYMIKDVQTYEWYTIKAEGWTIEKDRVYFYDNLNPTVLVAKQTLPGINKVISYHPLTNRTVFLEGVDVGAVKMQFERNWNGLEPGYYEIKSYNGSFNRKFAENSITLYPGKELKAGDTIYARMVSKSGAASPWVFARIQVIPKPSLDFGPKLNVTYANGLYKVSAPLGIDIPAVDNLDLLGDIPLLDSIGFGVNKDDLEISGIMDETISIQLDFGGGGSYTQTNTTETKTKKKNIKVKAVANEIDITAQAELSLKYDFTAKEWVLYYAVLDVDGWGGRSWTKGYRVKKIDVGVDATLEIGAWVGGTLILNKNISGKRDYKGIIRLRPVVEVSLQGGPDWVNVRGYVDAYIPAELHVPTKYIEVEAGATAGITATFLTYSTTLLEEELFNLHWDNGNPKVTYELAGEASRKLMNELAAGDAELSPMPRDYLNRESRWLAGSQATEEEQLQIAAEKSPLTKMAFSSDVETEEEPNPKNETMKENVYPEAEVQLVQNGDELWMVWTEDNPERSEINRTQMMYAVLKDGKWSEPEWIGRDGTADFSPAAAAAGEGVLMAWQDIKYAMPSDAEPALFVENAEITVTESVYKADGSGGQSITLTNDDKFDHSPRLTAGSDNNALLVWTKSEGLGFILGEYMEELKSPANSDRLLFSSWNGSTWSAPQEIEDRLPTVMSSSLAMHGEEGLLLYTLDKDNDQTTEDDRELYYRIYNGATWESEQLITDEMAPANPKAVYCNGEWFITWYSGGSIMYMNGLTGEARTEEFLANIQSDYKLAIEDEGETRQIALVYKNIGNEKAQGLSTSFYDIENRLWSAEIPLSEGESFVKSFSPVFTGDGELKIAYSKAEIATEVIDGVEYKNITDKADLYMLSYMPVHDLALEESDSLVLNPEKPLPGTVVKVSAIIRNKGDFAENATLYLYDGVPGSGKIIGEVTTDEPIPARSSVQAEIEWVMDTAARDEYDIYAVVQPAHGITEYDKDNNTVNRLITTADIAITSVECENIGAYDYLVTATVENLGSSPLKDIAVMLDNGLSVEVLDTIDELYPGEKLDLSFHTTSHGIEEDEDGKTRMTLNVELPVGLKENSTDNNTHEFVLEPAAIVVDSVDPLQNEASVDTGKKLTFAFNMNVEEGDGFEQIVLKDEYLNPVDINKTIEGNTLTVMPQSPMANDTQYTLTIPRGAVDDSYGHSMEEDFSLSFTTTTSSPEVVFAYPGDEMDGVEIDSEIKMKFNQDILSGPAFGEIAMYGPGSRLVSAKVTLQGEWMYVSPKDHLNGNMQYSLVIPRGAVENDKGVAQQEDFTLEYTTARASGSGDDDSDSPGHNQTSGKPETEQPAYNISRQVMEDGSSRAIVDINEQAVLKLRSANEEMVTLDVTDKTKDDKAIKINLSEGVLQLLINNRLGLNIVTGKGGVSLPAELVKALAGLGKFPISVTIAESNRSISDNDRVSAGIFDFSITAGDIQVTSFEPNVTVMIPLDMSKVGYAKRIIACVYDEADGSWQPVGGAADAAKGLITFRTAHFSTYAAFEKIMHFDDVTSSWAKDKVEVLASRRLIGGKSDKAFAPDDTITRAEFAAMIVRSLYTGYSPIRDTFSDVPADAWFAASVETAYKKGLVNGSGASRFDPNEEITREQMAVIAYRLYLYKAGNRAIGQMGSTFTDRQEISAYAEEAVNFVSDARIMIGSGGRFEPGRSATRQEAAVVLYRLLEYMGEL